MVKLCYVKLNSPHHSVSGLHSIRAGFVCLQIELDLKNGLPVLIPLIFAVGKSNDICKALEGVTGEITINTAEP